MENRSLKVVALSATLLISMQPSLRANEQSCEQTRCEPKKCIVKRDIAEALIHVGTHEVACVMGAMMAVCGVLLDEAAKKKNKIDTLYMGSIAGVIAGLYTIYSMPQWTDTYLLDKNTQRSRVQNMVTFISRILGGEWGVIVGEMFNFKQDAMAAGAGSTNTSVQSPTSSTTDSQAVTSRGEELVDTHNVGVQIADQASIDTNAGVVDVRSTTLSESSTLDSQAVGLPEDDKKQDGACSANSQD